MPKILHTGCGLEVDLAAPSACATGALGDTLVAYETGLNDGDLDNALLDTCANCAFSDRDAVFDSTVSGEANIVDGSLHNVQRDSFVPPQLDATAVAAGYAGYIPVETHPEPLEPIVKPEERTQQKDPPRLDRYVPGLMTGQAGIDAIMEEVAQDVIVPTKKAPKLIPFEELLTSLVPHYTAGGSLFGWSKVKTAKACLRAFYWQYVRQISKQVPDEDNDPYLDASAGKSKRVRVNALELGTMVHLCIETIYRTGSLDEGWKICDLIKGSRPELALEARRLVHFYLRRFNAEEVKTWDLRGVEVESRYFFPARKLRGKRRSCCITSRHDHLYRATKNGAKLPPGTVADSGEMRIHELKCLDANEFLWDEVARTRVVAGDLLATRTARVPTFNLLTNHQQACVAEIADNGIEPTFEVTLSSGRQALLTGNHPVWTATGWTPAAKLRADDCVACAPLQFRGKDRLSNDEAALIGYFLGDGYLGPVDVRLSTGRADLMRHIQSLLDRGGNTYYIVGNKNRVPMLQLHRNQPFQKTLDALKLKGHLAATKFVPSEILGATDAQIKIFLAALWSTDGHIGAHASRNHSLDIHYDTMSPQLARDVQQLLWRLGIWSTNHDVAVKYKNWAEQGKNSHCVKIATRQAKLKFVREVLPLMICRTKLTVEDALQRILINKKDRADFIPSALIAKALPNGLPPKHRRHDVRNYKTTVGVCRWVVADACAFAPELTPLVESPLQWDKVVSNRPLGRRPTVAVTVPKQPVFLTGDGLVTHNTTSSLTSNRLKAFYVDAQILLHLLSYNHGHFTTPAGEVLAPSTAEVFGTTDTVTVTVVGKRKVEDSQEDIARMNYAISEPRVLSFRDDLYDWLYEEVYDRLFSDAWLDPDTWRKDWMCRDLYYCPTLDQRILTADLRWIPAGDLRDGDELLAFDANATIVGRTPEVRRKNHQRRFTLGRVLHTAPVKRRVLSLVLEDGTILRAAAKHPWLCAQKRALNQVWLTSEQIADRFRRGVNTYMLRLFDLWEPNRSYGTGWLAGIYDGEGYLSFRKDVGDGSRDKMALGVSQNPGPIYDQVIAELTSHGFKPSEASCNYAKKECRTVRIRGGWREEARVLGIVRPQRLIARFVAALRDGTLRKQVGVLPHRGPLHVVDIRDEGDQWCAGLETDVHTYICEGFGSHNSSWICPYASICMTQGHQWDQLYTQPKGDFNRELLELPPKLAKLAAEKAAATAEVEGK